MREHYERLLRGDLSALVKGDSDFEALGRLLGAETQSSAPIRPRGAAHEALSSWLRFRKAQPIDGDDIFARLVRQWSSLFDGGRDLDERLVVDSTGASEAFAAVVAQSQRSMYALLQNDAPRATMLARRASRMARVEGLLAAEYLANIVLARARRHSGQPFLSLRIGSALEKVVPTPWRSWLAWELLFAGGPAQLGDVMDAIEGPAQQVQTALDAALVGDRNTYETIRQGLKERGLPAPMHADFAALDALVDPEVKTPPHAGFFAGETCDYPITLTGWPSSLGAGVGVCVVVPEGAPARRVLPTKLGLGDATFIADGERKSRVHAFVAALALSVSGAGEEDVLPAASMQESALFERVWGFEYVPDKHETLLKTVVKRARTDLAGCGEIERGGGEIRLHVSRRFAIADPRCRPSLNDQLLSALAAAEGRFSAKEAAERLGVSVRYVQGALKNLVEDGACERIKDGRNVKYALEDTTFDQPTLSRLKPG